MLKWNSENKTIKSGTKMLKWNSESKNIKSETKMLKIKYVKPDTCI